MTTMTMQETAAKAADLIDEKGWCQGRYISPDGRICMAQAIATVEGVQPLGVRSPLWAHLFGLNGVPATRWNDMYGRTHEQVTSLLRDIAAGTAPTAAAS